MSPTPTKLFSSLAVAVVLFWASFLGGCSSTLEGQNRIGAEDEKVIPENYSLTADRSKLDGLRKEIPEEVRTQNDEDAFILQLFATPDRKSSEIRRAFDQAAAKKRKDFDRDLRKERDDFDRKERTERADFLKKLEQDRKNFDLSRRSKEQKSEFRTEQEEARREFFANQKESAMTMSPPCASAVRILRIGCEPGSESSMTACEPL